MMLSDPLQSTSTYVEMSSTVSALTTSGTAVEFNGLGAPQQQHMHAPSAQLQHALRELGLTFTGVVGDQLPFKLSNVGHGREYEDLERAINVKPEREPPQVNSCLWASLNVIGSTCGNCVCCCRYCQCPLVPQGHYGFIQTSGTEGKVELLGPGRYQWFTPFKRLLGIHSLADNQVVAGNITIIRVAEGQIGLAVESSMREILLPGLHVRNSASFIFDRFEYVNKELIDWFNIKILIVPAGSVYACYDDGFIKIFTEGRYFINKGSFFIGAKIPTQQTNFRLGNHQVLLDGGIGMIVEGLLTYQVVDAKRLALQIGPKDLQRAITDVTKAELARVFASLHLEQISKANFQEPGAKLSSFLVEQKIDFDAPPSLLGKDDTPTSAEGETRNMICELVVRYMRPLTDSWGVNVVNFQLESTKIADPEYAQRYESASLEVAKAKADLRTQFMQSQIQIQRAQADAAAAKLQADGLRHATIIRAEADSEKQKIEARAAAERLRIETEANVAKIRMEAKANAERVETQAQAEAIRIKTEAAALAEARRLEGKSRNDAAESMSNDFAQRMAITGQQVEFARTLRPDKLNINVMPDTALVQGMLGAGLLTNVVGAAVNQAQ